MAVAIVVKRRSGFWMFRSQICEPESNIEVLPAVKLRTDKPFIHRLCPNRSEILAAIMAVGIKQVFMEELLKS